MTQNAHNATSDIPNMSGDPAPSTPSATSRRTSAAKAGRFADLLVENRWALPACVLAGCLPFVAIHLVGLLGKPHYQFAIFVPLGAVLLIRRALGQASTEPESSGVAKTFVCILLGAGLVTAAAATWLWSPWLGTFSFILLGLPLLWWLARGRGVAHFIAPCLFCCVLLPPPFGMDEDLTLWLRNLATEMTSSVLDQIGVLHLHYANVIEIPAKALFVADACSGIHSLFVLLAAALFLGLWWERGPTHLACLLIATFGLVLVENVARLSIVAMALGWQIDLSAGWRHEFLGAILFLCSVGLVFSADQLLLFLLPFEFPLPLFGWGKSPRRTAARGGANAIPSPGTASKGVQAFFVFIAALFPLLGIAQWWRRPLDSPQLSSLMTKDLVFSEFGENLLPSTINGFERVDYAIARRVAGDPLGKHSQQWTYRKGLTSVVMSLDYPYDGTHDLCVCYSQIGWEIAEKGVLSDASLVKHAGVAAAPVAMGRMTRPLYGNGLLLFSLCDTNGKIGAVVKEIERGSASDRAASRLFAVTKSRDESLAQDGLHGASFEPSFGPPPYLQFQLLARSHELMSEVQVQELLSLFIESRRILRDRCLHEMEKLSKS